MDVELLRNGDIFNLHLGSGASSVSQHPQPPKRHQQYPLTPSAQTVIQKERKNSEKRSNCCQIISYCLGLCSSRMAKRGRQTWNPALRQE